MENDYYTPEIEEFHVGFEYESITLKNQWIKKSSDDQDIVEVKACLDINPGIIRVKHLDTQGIEEVFAELKGDAESMGGDKAVIGISINHWWRLVSSKGYIYELLQLDSNVYIVTQWLTAGAKRDLTIFRGKIKNKSELKRLLKQLGI